MPVYDYKCREHGVFTELATMTAAHLPQPCPTCGGAAARILRLPPALTLLTPATREAHTRNEKSQHAPATTAERRAHGDHCCQPPAAAKGSRALLTAQGEKIFPSHRPWMISH